MSGYYPPGVTGNEPEIAGYPETSEDVECAEDDVIFLTAHQVHEILAEQGEWAVAEAVGYPSIQVKQEECGYAGTVDGQVVDGVFVWDCPRCGAEQEMELDDGPDPDEQRDIEMDRD